MIKYKRERERVGEQEKSLFMHIFIAIKVACQHKNLYLVANKEILFSSTLEKKKRSLLKKKKHNTSYRVVTYKI